MKEIRKKLTAKTKKAIEDYKTRMKICPLDKFAYIAEEAKIYVQALVDMEIINIEEACGLCNYLKIGTPRF